MKATESESRLDEIERDNLQSAIEGAERLIANLGNAAPPTLKNFVANAKGRVGVLERKIKEDTAERESSARERVAVAQLVAQETRLSAAEKEQYGGFLSKEFFTKNDFANLEQFYAKSWDRLSDDGKNQLSTRIWEGVRREEYKFSELPKTVREKETEQAYKVLRDAPSVIGVPEGDRKDFLRAYESGKREDAGEVLGRESFKKSLFRGKESAARAHSGAERNHSNDRDAAAASLAASPQSPKEPARSPKGTDRDLSAALEGVQLADVQGPASSAQIPNGKEVSGPKTSTRGC